MNWDDTPDYDSPPSPLAELVAAVAFLLAVVVIVIALAWASGA